MVPVYSRIVNLILDSGKVHDAWCSGTILPIYKSKCNVNCPDNLRGISIISFFGTRFIATAVKHSRLGRFLENLEILQEEQAGFPKEIEYNRPHFVIEVDDRLLFAETS